MGRKRKMSEAQELAVVDWWQAQRPAKDIAAEMGVSVTTLHTALMRRGVLNWKRLTFKEWVARNHLKEQEKAALAGGRGAAVQTSNGSADRRGMSTSQLYHACGLAKTVTEVLE